jgi:hypothetical protein
MEKISQAFFDSIDLKLLDSKSRVKALGLDFRLEQYKHISLLAKRHGIKTYVCGYKNPDVGGDFTCKAINWQKYLGKSTRQYQLFSNQHSEITIS